ncbi:MAG: UDP-N-acetylglucosamine--N-acetylmuramyl-(pentapeptide) pyrophosphoryl-undecaprenol N-acetylglucosamine transferase [Actinobacteria bacterium]|nr:UDP-N-acetylglucosamine--N-acetylmuramyl-(pentapeptide) pyrophosphoryl-undecaprenol N-acetylglucosamine transferase [Actinomycetota bacterium]
MRVLLAGGGTAGHVEPALNAADVLLGRDPTTDILLLGTARGLEVRLVPERGYELALISAVPLPRRPNRDLLALPTRLRRAVREVRQLMDRQGTDVVVGFGGYVAMPAYLAARGRVPIVIHEANAKAGIANRLGARFTPHVVQATAGSIKGAQTIGIPLRTAIADLDRMASRSHGRDYFGLDPERPCLLVFGGSLGARRINDSVFAAVPGIVGSGYQVLHVLGGNNLDQGADVSQLPDEVRAHYHPVGYVDRMDLAYAAADLALCRSGAMTCAELAAVGLGAIYVPLPHGNGEQRLNAAGIVAAGGGEFLLDEQLSGESVTRAVLSKLEARDELETMCANAQRMGNRGAGEELANIIVRAANPSAGANTGDFPPPEERQS